MGCSPFLAKAKEGGHPMSKERAETQVSRGPPDPPCSLGMTMGAYIVWWLLQSVDFTYQLSKIFIGRRLQASSQLTSLRGVVCQIRFKTDRLVRLLPKKNSCF